MTGTGAPPRLPVRLSLSLPGGAALGAFQAGATAALLVGVHELRRRGEDVVVDAVGGASSGSLVALFAARCLLDGADPVDLLHGAWVDEVSLDLLRDRGREAPLSFERLRSGIDHALDPGGTRTRSSGGHGGSQESPLALHVALTGLQGLSYEIADREGPSATAVTYADWGTFVLHPGRGVAQLVEPPGRSPLDFALASAAHPAAFAPRLLDRSEDVGAYCDNGISDFPASRRLWYTDGGLVQIEPIGRVLAAARLAAGDAPGRRLHVMVDPRNEGPSGAGRWGDPDAPASWTEGLSRAIAILPSQILYDDFRRTARDNRRLADVDAVAEALAPLLGGDDGATALRAAFAGLAGSAADRDVDADPRTALRGLLAHLAGVHGKQPVTVELVSPLVLADAAGRAVTGLLAGEFLATFGGFLRRELRESDFALGWRSALAWMPDGFRRGGFAGAVVDDVVAAVDERRDRRWRQVDAGDAGLEKLPFAARLALARLVAHTAKVLAARVMPRWSGGAARRRPPAAPGPPS